MRITLAMTGIGMILIFGSGLLLGVAYEWSVWGLAGIVSAALGGLLIGLANKQTKRNRLRRQRRCQQL